MELQEQAWTIFWAFLFSPSARQEAPADIFHSDQIRPFDGNQAVRRPTSRFSKRRAMNAGRKQFLNASTDGHSNRFRSDQMQRVP